MAGAPRAVVFGAAWAIPIVVWALPARSVDAGADEGDAGVLAVDGGAPADDRVPSAEPLGDGGDRAVAPVTARAVAAKENDAAPAQQAEEPATKPTAEPAVDSDDAHDDKPVLAFELGDVWLTPFVAPGYTPELGGVLTVGGVVSFPTDDGSPRSSVTAVGGYGTVGALIVQMKVGTHWLGDRMRFELDGIHKNLPDHYFGVGFDAGRNTPQGDDTTALHRVWVEVKPALVVRIVSDLFAGARYELGFTEASDMSAGVADDPYIQRDGRRVRVSGVGPLIRFDSRDSVTHTRTGTYADASYLFYATEFGGTHAYELFDLDFRQFITLVREGSTLGLALRTQAGRGTIPWSEMPLVGSPYDLRGYRWGQYRAPTAAYGIAEYRYQFYRLKKRGTPRGLSPHGVVGWAGVGALGDDYASLDGPMPNGGIGYRFAVQPRIFLRLDLGFGIDAVNVYLNVGEAF